MVTIAIQLIVFVMTIVTFFKVLFRKVIPVRRYSYFMVVNFCISLIHSAFQLISFYTSGSPLLEWLFTFSGVWLLTVFVLTQMELLSLFCSLTTAITSSRIRNMQLVAIGVQFFIHAGFYLQLGSLGRRMDGFIHIWFSWGTSVFAILCTLYDTAQTIYLLKLLYKHFQETRKETLHYCIPRLIRFAAGAVVVCAFDFVGIALFAFVPLGAEGNVWALEILHFRIILLVFMFLELRSITVKKDYIFSRYTEMTEPPRLVKDLTLHNTKELEKTRVIDNQSEISTAGRA
jgi:hypothetical protein